MRDYVLTLLVAAAVTYMLTPLVIRLAGRIGALKKPRERDVHVVPIPTLGGLAMYGGLLAALLVADQIPLLRSAFANTGMVSGLLLAGGLLVVIGFIDDRWGMTALPKAAGQVAAGAILVATGTSLSWLPLPGGDTFYPTTDQQALLTIVIVVATINAVNFIDGLDGLAAGVVGIAAVSFFAYYYTLTKVVDISSLAAPALASAILIGVCLGFLPHNFSPAKVFMGDTGSMLLGLLLAYAPISSINSLPPAELVHQINRYPEILPLLLPAALLVIPYADLLLAVVRRTRAGQSPFAPDRKHLHHRLLDIGHSQRASVLIMYLWASVFSGSIVWLSVDKTQLPRAANHHGEPILVFVLITLAAVGALLLMSMPRLRWWQRPRSARAGTVPAAAGKDAAEALGAAAEERDLAGLAAGALAPPVVSAPVAADSLTGPLPGQAGDRPGLASDPFGSEPLRADPLHADPLQVDPLRADPLQADPPDHDQFAVLRLSGDPSSGEVLAEDWPTDGWSAGRPLAEADSQAGSWRVRQPVQSAPPSGAALRGEPGQPLSFWRQPEGDGVPQAAERLADEAGDPGRSVIGTVPPAVSGRGMRPAPRRQPGGGFTPQLRGTTRRSAGSPQSGDWDGAAWGSPVRESAVQDGAAWGSPVRESAAPDGAGWDGAAWASPAPDGAARESAAADWWQDSDGSSGDASGGVTG